MDNVIFNWFIPPNMTPICFTEVTHSIVNTSNETNMESWSVEEYDYSKLVLNFRSTSTEASRTIFCYSNNIKIGILELPEIIEPYVFYSVKIEYPKERESPFVKYRQVLLKSQSSPSYPIFTYNSHTHIDLWGTENNRYEFSLDDSSPITDAGGIVEDKSELINSLILNPTDSKYITSVVSDTFDFR